MGYWLASMACWLLGGFKRITVIAAIGAAMCIICGLLQCHVFCFLATKFSWRIGLNQLIAQYVALNEKVIRGVCIFLPLLSLMLQIAIMVKTFHLIQEIICLFHRRKRLPAESEPRMSSPGYSSGM